MVSFQLENLAAFLWFSTFFLALGRSQRNNLSGHQYWYRFTPHYDPFFWQFLNGNHFGTSNLMTSSTKLDNRVLIKIDVSLFRLWDRDSPWRIFNLEFPTCSPLTWANFSRLESSTLRDRASWALLTRLFSSLLSLSKDISSFLPTGLEFSFKEFIQSFYGWPWIPFEHYK